MVFPGHNRLTIRINETGSVIWSAGLPFSTPQRQKTLGICGHPGVAIDPIVITCPSQW
jgi:hypothetical protein